MHPLAQTALEQLLISIERKRAKALDASEVSFPFTDGRFSSYAQASVSELESAHADLLMAARSGAIRIEWEPGAGHQKRVLRIRAGDSDSLAKLVGRIPSWDQVAAAEVVLAPWKHHARVQELLGRWRAGRAARSKGPGTVLEWRDALRVIDQLASHPSADVAVRRISAELFQDSKRIESIAACLDYLTASGDQPARETPDLLAELGLLRYPQPVFISASGCRVRLASGETLPSVVPYCALPPEAITGLDEPVRYFLTIENLTTFHEVVRQKHAVTAVVMFTGGMPSPSFLAAYVRLLSASVPQTQVFHWGDVDLGGFRIAAKLADVASQAGHALQLWGALGLSSSLGGRKVLQRAELDAIRDICEIRGWGHVSAEIEKRGVAAEQEQLVMNLPWNGLADG